MCSKLALATFQRSYGTQCYNFSVGMTEYRTCKYVAEKVGLEVIVFAFAEVIAKWLARKLCLYLRSFLQRIEVLGQYIAVVSQFSGYTLCLSVGYNLLQLPQGIKRTRETRVSIQL